MKLQMITNELLNKSHSNDENFVCVNGKIHYQFTNTMIMSQNSKKKQIHKNQNLNSKSKKNTFES